MPERHTITLELDDTQVRVLRHAVYDYAVSRHAARMDRLRTVSPHIPSDRHPSPVERAAWELSRLVNDATSPVAKEDFYVPHV